MSNDIIYVVGARAKASSLKDLSFRIMNNEILKRYFSQLPMKDANEVADKILKDLSNGGKSQIECVFGLFKIYTKAYVETHGEDWTIKGYDPTLAQ